MHPILARRERLLAYILAWVPLAGIQAYLLALPGSLSYGEAAALAAPLSLVYAFLCLSSFYACRSAPLTRSRTGSVLGVHAVGALIAAALLTLAGSTLASLLGTFPSLATLPERFSQAVPPLFVLGVLLYLLAVTFHYILLSLESSQAAERRAMEARVLAREAELEALKAQLNPHFLFNALNSVSALTTTAPARAREMCVLLSDFLRRSLSSGERSLIPLREELELARQFLAVEKVRYGRRLEVEEEVDEALLSTVVPPLLLQPLVENAVRHGIATLIEGGTVTLRVERAGDGVRVAVENPYDPETPAPAGSGLGLSIVRRRLAAAWGRAAEIDERSDGKRFAVVLVVPAAAPERGVSPLRVVVVDDEELARGLVREHLAAYPDVEVVAECANGLEAIEAVAAHAPDLLFLDVQMPRLTGFETLELLDPRPAVVFVTAYDRFAVRAFEVNAVDYLLKPFSKERFDAALAKARALLGPGRNAPTPWPSRPRHGRTARRSSGSP